MPTFEYKERLIEVLYVAPVGSDPVRLECTDLRDQMLFAIHRDSDGMLLFQGFSDRIPVDLIHLVSRMAEENL